MVGKAHNEASQILYINQAGKRTTDAASDVSRPLVSSPSPLIHLHSEREREFKREIEVKGEELGIRQNVFEFNVR